MEETILTFKDAVILLSGIGSIIILGDVAYILDGEYREKIIIGDLELPDQD